MPVLRQIRERFERERPLEACALRPASTSPPRPPTSCAPSRQAAPIALCASNPLSQDDVAASLVQDFGVSTFAIKGEDTDSYYNHIVAALAHSPQITMDDGADLVSSLLFIALDRLGDVQQRVRMCLHPHCRRAPRPRGRRARRARRPPPALSACGHGKGRRAALPRGRGERVRHQAPV